MRIRLAVLFLAIFSNGCIGLAVPIVAAGAGYGVSKVITNPVVALRTGSVVLDSVNWSKASDDSTKMVVRGLMTWKKARMGPNNTPYLNVKLDAANILGMTQQGATGMFQVDLIGADGNAMTTVGQSTLTVWDGKDEITMIPADKPFRFDLHTTPVAWNILRDAKSKTIKFVVVMR